MESLGLWVVVLLPALGVAESIVGSLDLLEPLGITALVRMVLAGQSAIGPFDFVGCGVATHAQCAVVILCHGPKQKALYI